MDDRDSSHDYDSDEHDPRHFDDRDGHMDNKDDIERQKKNMQRDLQRSEKELTREFKSLKRRASYVSKHLRKRSERINKFVEKVGSNEQFKNLQSSIKAAIARAEKLESIVETLNTNFKSDYSKLKSIISALSDNYEDINTAWNQLRRVQDPYWARRESVEMRVNAAEMLNQIWDFRMEKAKLIMEYKKAGVDVPDGLTKANSALEALFAIQSKVKKLDDQMKTEVEKLNSITDDEELMSALEDFRYVREDIQFERQDLMDEFQFFDWQELWSSVESGWEGLHTAEMHGNLQKEVEKLAMELKNVKEFVDYVSSLGVAELDEPVKRLSVLVEKGSKSLEEMKSSNGDNADELWDYMDEIGRIAKMDMKKIFMVLKKHPKHMKTLKHKFDRVDEYSEFGKEEIDFEEDWNYEQFEDKERENLDRLKDKIREEVKAEVMRQVGDNIIAELAPILGDAGAEKIVGRVMNRMDVFGDKGADLLGSYAAMRQKISEMDESSYDSSVKALIEEAKNVIPVASLEEDFVSIMEEIRKSDREGAKELISKLKSLLAKNEELSTKGDEAYQFADVRLNDDDWYFDHVIKLKNEGHVSGYKDENGELTGDFGPGNDVTLAEVLKMTYEGSKKGGDSGSSSYKSAKGHWAEKYLRRAENEGLDKYVNFDDINRPATREDVAIIVGEGFELVDKHSACESPFADYKGNYKCHLESAKEHGVFTGTGEGLFEGNRSINRAEVSKVINIAIEEASTDEFINELEVAQ